MFWAQHNLGALHRMLPVSTDCRKVAVVGIGRLVEWQTTLIWISVLRKYLFLCTSKPVRCYRQNCQDWKKGGTYSTSVCGILMVRSCVGKFVTTVGYRGCLRRCSVVSAS